MSHDTVQVFDRYTVGCLSSYVALWATPLDWTWTGCTQSFIDTFSQPSATYASVFSVEWCVAVNNHVCNTSSVLPWSAELGTSSACCLVYYAPSISSVVTLHRLKTHVFPQQAVGTALGPDLLVIGWLCPDVSLVITTALVTGYFYKVFFHCVWYWTHAISSDARLVSLKVKNNIILCCVLEVCIGMGKTGIPWVPWDFHGNGNTISHGNGMGWEWE